MSESECVRAHTHEREGGREGERERKREREKEREKEKETGRAVRGRKRSPETPGSQFVDGNGALSPWLG